MNFDIFMGEPEMLRLWNDLQQKAEAKALNSEERELFDKRSKALELLSGNPRHPGLESHEIDDLSKKYGFKVWQSHLENRRAGARRMFWSYGTEKGCHHYLGAREASQYIAEERIQARFPRQASKKDEIASPHLFLDRHSASVR